MAIQHLIMLALAALATLYMARGLVRSACGSGCGKCKSKGCPTRKLETIRARVESNRP